MKKQLIKTGPRSLGMLLLFLGLTLFGGGMYLTFFLNDPNPYFMVVGIVIAISGLLFYRGLQVALLLYGIALLIIWGWSFADLGMELARLIPRVALPTLIAFYVYSPAVRTKLH